MDRIGARELKQKQAGNKMLLLHINSASNKLEEYMHIPIVFARVLSVV